MLNHNSDKTTVEYISTLNLDFKCRTLRSDSGDIENEDFGDSEDDDIELVIEDDDAEQK